MELWSSLKCSSKIDVSGDDESGTFRNVRRETRQRAIMNMDIQIYRSNSFKLLIIAFRDINVAKPRPCDEKAIR